MPTTTTDIYYKGDKTVPDVKFYIKDHRDIVIQLFLKETTTTVRLGSGDKDRLYRHCWSVIEKPIHREKFGDIRFSWEGNRWLIGELEISNDKLEATNLAKAVLNQLEIGRNAERGRKLYVWIQRKTPERWQVDWRPTYAEPGVINRQPIVRYQAKRGESWMEMQPEDQTCIIAAIRNKTMVLAPREPGGIGPRKKIKPTLRQIKRSANIILVSYRPEIKERWKLDCDRRCALHQSNKGEPWEPTSASPANEFERVLTMIQRGELFPAPRPRKLNREMIEKAILGISQPSLRS